MWTLFGTIACTLSLLAGVISDVMHFEGSWLIYLIGILFGGLEITIVGLRELVTEKHFNVDLLMMIAAISAGVIGDWREGTLLIFIFSLSHLLEEYATDKSTRAINHLINRQAKIARKILDDGTYQIIDANQLTIGDHLAIFKGESVPTDGIILQGASELDEAVVNGESMPRLKKINEEVFGGTINLGNELIIEVNKNKSETVFAKIIQLVEDAQNSQTKTETFIQKIENRYVLSILLGVPLAILLFHFILNWSWNESFYRGVNLLVVASPCALVASSTPALLSAVSNGARHGVLFKGGTYLEELAEIRSIAFDKTGTLTNGQPTVTNVFWTIPEEEIIPIVIGLEAKSTHPLAKAIVRNWQSHPKKQVVVEELTAKGIQGMIDGNIYYIGKKMGCYEDNPQIKKWKLQGKTVVYMECNQQFIGAIALLDTLNKHAKEVIHYFNEANIHTLMLTGDNRHTATTIAHELGIAEYQSELLPEDKVAFLNEQKQQFGKNAMLGDGVNDAPALATATIGIAMGEGTDVAMDIADVVILENNLAKLVYTHKLSKKMKQIIKQNIIFSLAIILLLVLINILQILTIPLAVIGHEGSTILVILNGLRLLKTIND
ncbi:MAG TPA: heavy metal translocating P-type ATPase [Enterococcus sp.]|nr:heavy metal translocating P-type ATPase [Enterococcus sp.]